MRKSRKSSRRGSRGRSSKSSPRWGLIAAIAALPLTLVGGGGALLWQHIGVPKMHEVSFCFDHVPQEQSAFFIDNSFTGSTSDAQRRDLQVALEEAYNELPPNGRLSVFTTARDSNGSIAKPVLSLCRPAATTQELSTIAEVPSKPPAYLARQADEARAAYRRELQVVLADAKAESKQALDSPILEEMQAISRYRFSGRLRRFYVFTDGIQNTEAARFCQVKGHLPPYELFKGREIYNRVQPDHFTGADVEFLMVQTVIFPTPHLPHCKKGELQRFWEAYFRDHGAASVRTQPIRHGAVKS